MKSHELQHLKDALKRRKKELMGTIASDQAMVQEKLQSVSGEPSIDFNHPADMISDDPDYEKDIVLVERQKNELLLINDALRRMDNDDYGMCLSCGDDIPYQRLNALPYARFCIGCEREAELTRKSS